MPDEGINDAALGNLHVGRDLREPLADVGVHSDVEPLAEAVGLNERGLGSGFCHRG